MIDGDDGNERVIEDEDALGWEVVYRASKVGEPTRYTRQTTKKIKVTLKP